MRRNPQRPRSRDGKTVSPRPVEPPTKKVFNCIVDDSALLAGAKKSTRDGIRKWISNGQIRLFVPLYTLAQATRLKDGSGRISSDAEDALVWLDDATSTAPHLVTLQGGYEKFETWAEVEKFALPKTLFSEGDLDDELDGTTHDLAQQTESKLSIRDMNQSMSSADTDGSRSVTPSSVHSERSSVSAVSPPPESPTKTPARGRLQKPNNKNIAHTTNGHSAASGVPAHLRSLFNYILWRIHQEIDPVAALESFIFLTDDPTKIKLAQRFGIRTKSLADIRYVVAREEREFRNRQVVQRKESEINAVQPRVSPRAAVAAVAPVKEMDNERPELLPVDERPAPVSDEEEDEILLKRPPKAPAAMLAQQSPKAGNKVMDPNQFSRGAPVNGRGSTRGGSVRGNATRGRGAAFNPGNAGAGRGTANGGARVDLTPATSSGPIDPNSFNRPPANTNRFRGGRRLWVPT